MIRLDHAATTEAIADLNQRLNLIEAALEQLEAEVKTLGGAWGGGAQQSYEAAQRRWWRQMNELRRLASSLTTGATAATATLQSTEAAALKLWQ